MRDEIFDILVRIRNQPLPAARVSSWSVNTISTKEDPEGLENALHEAKKYLHDGQWKRFKRIKAICRKYKVSLDLLSYYLTLAESDNGCWLAMVTPATPIYAPDDKHSAYPEKQRQT